MAIGSTRCKRVPNDISRGRPQVYAKGIGQFKKNLSDWRALSPRKILARATHSKPTRRYAGQPRRAAGGPALFGVAGDRVAVKREHAARQRGRRLLASCSCLLRSSEASGAPTRGVAVLNRAPLRPLAAGRRRCSPAKAQGLRLARCGSSRAARNSPRHPTTGPRCSASTIVTTRASSRGRPARSRAASRTFSPGRDRFLDEVVGRDPLQVIVVEPCREMDIAWRVDLSACAPALLAQRL